VIVTDGQVNLVPGTKIEAKNGVPEAMAGIAGHAGEAAAAADSASGDANRTKSR
jgi:hypothetical protein